MVVVLVILLTRFLINRPSDIGQHPDNISPSEAAADASKVQKPRTYRTAHDWTLSQVFRSRAIYLILLINITFLGTGNFMVAHGALHLTDIGISKLEVASLVSIFILGSGLGRIPAGILGDRIEMRWLFTAIITMMLIAFTLFARSDSFMVLSFTGFIFGAGYGGFFALSPALLSNYFGDQSFAKINSFFAPIVLFFVAGVPAGAGFIYESSGSYDGPFLIGSVLLGLSILASAMLKPPVLKENDI